MLRDPDCKKPKPSVRMLRLRSKPSPYRIGTPLSRKVRRGFSYHSTAPHSLERKSRSCEVPAWLKLSHPMWVNLSHRQRLSNTLESAFCVEAWEAALQVGRQAPLICNPDQGSQFTSPLFLDAVESAGVELSIDGRGRWMDNRFIERLWRSVKPEDIYLEDYLDGIAAGRGLARWLENYNHLRPHQALQYATPAQWYEDAAAYGAQPATWEAMRSGPAGGA